MMNKKLLKLTRKNITKLAVCVLLCCISTSCKSQINILSNEISNLKPSSQIKNNYLNEIFEILLNDESTINWKLRTKKMFLVSRSEEHTSELQSRPHLVCRLLLEKKKKNKKKKTKEKQKNKQ